MSRLKTFRTYLILFLLFYLFVSVMSYLFARSAYVPIVEYNIEFDNPKVTIQEALATKVGGKITGIITNDTNETINDKYVKIDFISENGTYIISKNVKITTLTPGDTQEFKVSFNAEKIKTFNISINDISAESEDISKKWKLSIYEIAGVAAMVFTAVKLLPLIF